ncbi:MAG: methyltransferase domain-containing protein [Candidatus Melainabacteria bacterium]|nr:methyltransferase domain-containing protein [Candidatus Melainabacteria bacterium]
MINTLKKYIDKTRFSVFDYGIGNGTLLKDIKDMFNLSETDIGGCDISSIAIELSKKKLHSPFLFNEQYPKLNKQFDVIVCSEMIEHTTQYKQSLEWIYNYLETNGILILTTQSGKIHASDKYAGHTQHFKLSELNSLLIEIGFHINHLRFWGFPFFTLQKYLTNYKFSSIKEDFLEGEPHIKQRFIFSLAYIIYYIHDFINFGPQIYIVASK